MPVETHCKNKDTHSGQINLSHYANKPEETTWKKQKSRKNNNPLDEDAVEHVLNIKEAGVRNHTMQANETPAGPERVKVGRVATEAGAKTFTQLSGPANARHELIAHPPSKAVVGESELDSGLQLKKPTREMPLHNAIQVKKDVLTWKDAEHLEPTATSTTDLYVDHAFEDDTLSRSKRAHAYDVSDPQSIRSPIRKHVQKCGTAFMIFSSDDEAIEVAQESEEDVEIVDEASLTPTQKDFCHSSSKGTNPEPVRTHLKCLPLQWEGAVANIEGDSDIEIDYGGNPTATNINRHDHGSPLPSQTVLHQEPPATSGLSPADFPHG